MARGKGVPVGYKEDWAYHGRWSERKIRKGLWRFRFRATKRRRARSYGSFGKGTKGAWRIKGVQRIIKIGKGQYQTVFDGTKRPIYFSVKKPYKKYNRRRGYRRRYKRRW